MKQWSIFTTSFILAALTIPLQSNGSQGEFQWEGYIANLQINQKYNKIAPSKEAIVLAAFQIVDGDSGEVLLKMDKDGKCYLNTGFIGTITTAGEVMSDDGKPVAHLKGGQFMTSENKMLVTIKADGTISVGSEPEMTWGQNGFLTNSETGLKLVPANSKAKRAASILLSAFMGFGVTDSEQ